MLMGLFGFTYCVLGNQFVFKTVPASVVTNFNPSLLPYYAVAFGGTNFICVGSNSIASLASTPSPPAIGGYLTTSNAWVSKNVPGNYYLNSVAFGANIFVAAGVNNLTFIYSNANWSMGTNAITGNKTVDAEGLAYNATGDNFSLVSASYLAAYAPSANLLRWTNAYDTNAAFVESFRGITSMGGSNLALCGINGDIRISSNGGQSWNTNRLFDFIARDLYAIASDGSNTLVCVGNLTQTNNNNIYLSLVLVSTNKGNSWFTNTITNSISATNTFYAATYTGVGDNRFIIAGSDGNIFIASNNISTSVWAWTQVASGLTTTNIRGAAVATSGTFQGIITLVGDAGTIVVGGTLPQPPISLGNQTNCATYPNPNGLPNPPLVVAEAPDALHPVGSVTVDWFDAKTNLVATLTNSYVAVDSRPFDDNTPSNYVYLVRSRDLRTGLTSSFTNIILTVNPRPKSQMPDFSTANCNIGQAYTITNTLTGLGPWTVFWNDGTSQTTNKVGTGPVTIYYTVYPTNSVGANMASNNVYYVTAVSNADTCIGNQPGDITGTYTVTINPRPTATLQPFNATNCNDGTSFTLTNVLTGIGPWTVIGATTPPSR